MEKKKLELLLISSGSSGGGGDNFEMVTRVSTSATADAITENATLSYSASDTKRQLWQETPQPEDEDDSSPMPLAAKAPERMYPWLVPQSDSGSSSMNAPKEVRSAPAGHGYNSITAVSTEGGSEESPNAHARLLQPSATTSHTFWRTVNSTSSTTYGGRSRGTRHSILRFGSSKLPRSANDRIRKSGSVEFKLLEEEHLKRSANAVPSYTGLEISRETPRRLTDEEKEELYRVRPDLEIGPSPFFQEQMERLNQRNQKRIVFAMFGGMISIVVLLLFYALLARG